MVVDRHKVVPVVNQEKLVQQEQEQEQEQEQGEGGREGELNAQDN